MAPQILPDPKAEFRIPISATPQFLRMTEFFLESLRLFGGPIARAAHCVISVSPDTPVRDLHSECDWARDHSVEFRWVEPELLDPEYHGTGLHRMLFQTDADVVVLSDADIFIAGDFDDLIYRAHEHQALLGWLAHWSPFVLGDDVKRTPSSVWWDRIFAAAGLPPQPLTHQCPGWGHGYHDPEHRYCPDYFNGGFMVAPQEAIRKIGSTFSHDLACVEKVYDTVHKSQIASTVSQVRHGIQCELSGLIYNCPPGMPEKRLRASSPDVQGAEDVRVFHYLANAEINKKHFRTEEGLAAMLDRDDLSDSAKVLQRKMRQVAHEIGLRRRSV